MTRILYTEQFFDDLMQVELSSKEDEIFSLIDMLTTIPSFGSQRLPKAIEQRYGNQVRKLTASPFLVIYEYLERDNAIVVYGLVHQRAAY